MFPFISEGVHLFAMSEADLLAKPTGLQGGPGMAYSPGTAMPIDVHRREPVCMSLEIFGLRTEPSKSVKYHPPARSKVSTRKPRVAVKRRALSCNALAAAIGIVS